MTKPKPTPGGHAHFQVADTAKALAAAAFEELAKDNARWAELKLEGISQEDFVQRCWGAFLPQARATLAQMLTRPINEILKEQIADALIKDNTLIYGRTSHG